MNDCRFCTIVSKEAQASIVYEDDSVLAFMDLHPANVGHTLIIPREHWETIYDIPEKLLADLFSVVKRVSVAVKKSVDAKRARALLHFFSLANSINCSYMVIASPSPR